MDRLCLLNTMFNPHVAVVNKVRFAKYLVPIIFLQRRSFDQKSPEESVLFSSGALLRSTLTCTHIKAAQAERVRRVRVDPSCQLSVKHLDQEEPLVAPLIRRVAAAGLYSETLFWQFCCLSVLRHNLPHEKHLSAFTGCISKLWRLRQVCLGPSKAHRHLTLRP